MPPFILTLRHDSFGRWLSFQSTALSAGAGMNANILNESPL
jgi:hypothetical protein